MSASLLRKKPGWAREVNCITEAVAITNADAARDTKTLHKESIRAVLCLDRKS